MDNTLLNLGLWVAGGNSLREARQVVYTGDEDILNTAVFQLIQHAQPEFGGLVLSDPHAENILVAV